LDALGVSKDQFALISDFDVDEYDKSLSDGPLKLFAFHRHEIPKKNRNRGYRIVWEPVPFIIDAYKAAARRLVSFFSSTIEGFPHENCFGYVKGKNIRENAAMHCGARYLLKCDIQNFFGSIKSANVKDLFIRLGLDKSIASDLTTFLTIDDHLALGLPTSPVVANAICFDLDHDLLKIGNGVGARYSRYADDLTFSSNSNLPALADVEGALANHGFALSKEKTRTSKIGQNHYVTGLSVADHIRPHPPRSIKKRIRQKLYYCNKFGLDDHLRHLGITGEFAQGYINHLDGTVKYIAFHEPKLAPVLVPLWERVLLTSESAASFKPKNQDRSSFTFHVDETEFELHGRRFLALGMCVSQHQEEINQSASAILRDFLASPYADGKVENIKKNGLHFQDATADLRLEYIKKMQVLPFRGYIVFGELNDDRDYEAIFLKLLNAVVGRRLMAAESRAAAFFFEINNKVSQEKIRSAVNGAWNNLKKANNRHPELCSVDFVGKDAAGISTPDFLLGVFRSYIISGAPQTPLQRAHILFERLRDKIRLITNVDTGEEFGRRNPLTFEAGT
jgi:hypothetical protein